MRKIKVLNKKYEEKSSTYPRKMVCENCESELEYNESDLRMGEYGCVYVDCPVCGYENMMENDEHTITLTVDNIEFPIHFHHISIENGAKDAFDNQTIKKYIREAIFYFRENKDEFSWGCWITGNLYMNVHRYVDNEEYTVTVSNDFYEVDIPFEEIDY